MIISGKLAPTPSMVSDIIAPILIPFAVSAAAIGTIVEIRVIYGTTEAVINDVGEENILTSFPLGIYKVHIVTKKGQTVISNFKQLEN